MKIKNSNNLPTLKELVRALSEQNKYECENNSWHADHHLAQLTYMDDWHWPMREFINEEDEKCFVVTQTQGGRHTLKPNLRNRHYIYRGQNKRYEYILSPFSRDQYKYDDGSRKGKQKVRDKHVVANLKVEEFVVLLRKHPIFRIFDNGLFLHPESRPIFINMNYYGLSQHYGFKTGLVDFSTDLEVAAFFACTKCVGGNKYLPIEGDGKSTGVIYAHKIVPDVTFKVAGFSTIGLQLSPRTGAQKGILFNESPTLPLHKMVIAHPFIHDTESSRYFYDKMKSGTVLFPEDIIQPYATRILEGRTVSGGIYAQNLYSNQDSYLENIKSIEREGLKVDWNSDPHFEASTIHSIFQDVKNGLWEQFCRQIRFVDRRKGKQMEESLLNLPKNPAYAHFFKEEYYPIIYAQEVHIQDGAKRNQKKHL